MAVLQRLIALCVVLLCWPAYAAFPATVVTPGCTSGCFTYSFRGQGTHSTPAAACAAGLGQGQSTGYGWATYTAVIASYPDACNFTMSWSGGSGASGLLALSQTAVAPYPPVYSCPANSTLSGSSCSCSAGYVEDGSSCVVEPNEQEQLCAALSGTETYASAPGAISPGASSCNATGCMTTFAGTVIRVKDKAGVSVTEGSATFTGATCEYSSSTGSVEDTCPGGYQGEVNGVQTCVKYDPKLNTIETEGSKQSEVSEDGNTTQQSSSTTTTCSNGSCNSTTTTTTTVNGGTPTTKTETSSEPQTEYCTKNPRAPQCQEATSFGGSCAGSFTCTGDPVQCAAARAANEHLCRFDDLFDMDGTTRALAEAVINGTHVVNPKDTPQVVDVGMFDQSSPISTACPADVPFTLSGMALSIPLSQYCSQLQLMGNILVLFTLLGATVFVFRGST